MVKVYYKVNDKRYDYGYRVDSTTGTLAECIAKVRGKKDKLTSPWITVLDNGVVECIHVWREV